MTIARDVDGVDLSHHNDVVIDFNKAKNAGVKFFYHKCTEGDSVVDSAYDKRRRECLAKSMPFGGYHFARPSNALDAVKEANFFLKHLAFAPGDLIPMLDLEDTGGMSRSALTLWVKNWMLTVEKALRVKPIVYTNFDLDSTFGAYLWQARYSPVNLPPVQAEPWKRWDILQFSNGQKGVPNRVAGFPAPIDLNELRDGLTVAALRSPVGGPTPATPTNTGAFRVVTQNVQALPLMPQTEVKHDVMLTAAQAGIVGWQEIEPDRYDKTLLDLQAGGKWNSFWGVKGAAGDGRGAHTEGYNTPISYRIKYWTFFDGGRFLHINGKAGICKNRWVTWVILRHKITGTLLYVDNAHYNVAWNNKHPDTADLRKRMWVGGHKKHMAHVGTIIKEHPNMPLILLGDYNASVAGPAPLQMTVAGRKIQQGVGATSIDQIRLINGANVKGSWRHQIKSKETLTGRHSDHQGRRVRESLQRIP